MSYFIFYGIGVIQTTLSIFVWNKNIKNKSYLVASIFLLSIYSGLRFEVGMDWEGYRVFFEEIEAYFNPNAYNYDNIPKFELGFALLNFLIKLFTDKYSYVLLVSSLIFNISLYNLYKNHAENYIFAVNCYIGYSFLVIGFAQVRQGLSISLILYALHLFITNRIDMKHFWFLAASSILFHMSALIYVLIFIISYILVRYNRLRLYILMCVVCITITQLFDSSFIYNVLIDLIDNQTLQRKIADYRDSYVEESFALYFNCLILFLNVAILYSSTGCVEFRTKVIKCYFSSLSLAAVMSVVLLPGSYVYYSRLFLLISILQPIVITNKNIKNKIIYIILIMVDSMILLANYFKSLYAWGEVFTSYRIFIGQ